MRESTKAVLEGLKAKGYDACYAGGKILRQGQGLGEHGDGKAPGGRASAQAGDASTHSALGRLGGGGHAERLPLRQGRMRMQSAPTSTAPAWWLEAMKRPGCWFKPRGADIWLRVYATRQELDSWIQDWWDWLEFNSGLSYDQIRQASEELLRLRREMR